MLGHRKVLALIPARGGSKRVPGKNLRSISGQPLIGWTIRAAAHTEQIDRVVVSTDCEEIARVSKMLGAEVPFTRPANLSGDHATSDAVILHALEELGHQDFEVVVILQPTSPLRLSEDIAGALVVMDKKQADGIVSVCECEHPPYWSNVLPPNRSMGGFVRKEFQGQRSQDLPVQYRLNGAIYAFKTEFIKDHGGIQYMDSVYAFEMPASRSVDIDHESDFLVAEALLRNRTAH